MTEQEFKELSARVQAYTQAKRTAINKMNEYDTKLRCLKDDLRQGRGISIFDGTDKSRIIDIAKSIIDERKQEIQSALATELDLI
jgi:hypothetical protein